LAELERFVESILNPEHHRASLSEALTEYVVTQAGTEADLPLTEEYRISVREIVEDVLEEAGLIRAIDEGLQTSPTTRAEIFHILENAQ
jgi:hypothetical protein